MNKYATHCLIAFFAALLSQFVFANSVVETDEVETDETEAYTPNGISYMSMQADNGSWMDTVWLLEVEEASGSLFDVVVSPTRKRISVKVLTDIDSQEWISIWNRKLAALNLNNGLQQGQHAKAFSQVMQYLPQQLAPNDVFSIESDGMTAIRFLLNDEVLTRMETSSQFSFWLSAWTSASSAGIYVDGSMLAKGSIEPYLAKLFAEKASSSPEFFTASL